MIIVTRAAMTLSVLLFILILTDRAGAFTWMDQLPQTLAIDVYYDFPPTIMGQPNAITSWQAGSAVSAFQTWSSVSNLNFIQNPWAPESQIINIGATSIDGQWGILGQGGYNS